MSCVITSTRTTQPWATEPLGQDTEPPGHAAAATGPPSHGAMQPRATYARHSHISRFHPDIARQRRDSAGQDFVGTCGKHVQLIAAAELAAQHEPARRWHLSGCCRREATPPRLEKHIQLVQLVRTHPTTHCENIYNSYNSSRRKNFKYKNSFPR